MIKKIDKLDAICSLRKGSEWCYKDGSIIWLDDNSSCPTDEEIEKEIVRLQKEFDSKEYQRLRKQAYDKLNQDELRYNDLVNGTNTWQEAIEAIKIKYPKPE
jgi:hypothetical protein